jgi:hypothetical protein
VVPTLVDGMLTATFRRLGGAARLPFLDFLIFNLAFDFAFDFAFHDSPKDKAWRSWRGYVGRRRGCGVAARRALATARNAG